MASASAAAAAEPQTNAPVQVIAPTVLAEIPHDPAAYTEGLEFDGPALYEGTGQWGTSELRQIDPVNGAVFRSVPMPHNYFGEGITIVGDRIWQLTYRDGIAFEWDKASLTLLREVPLPGEHWGLCHDGGRLISSDGTDTLHFRDATDLAGLGSVAVTRDGEPVFGLNELECVDGSVWANVWPTDTIVRIDPGTGAVTLAVDASGLWPGGPRSTANVLSGVAYAGGGEYLLTGKYWPTAYRVRMDPE
ncbi:MAG: glutaminyl-peptide cyclotransferase [Mycobacterium sp.]